MDNSKRLQSTRESKLPQPSNPTIVAKIGEVEVAEIDDDEGMSLEELSRSYADLIQPANGSAGQDTADPDGEMEPLDPLEDVLGESEACPVTPQTIVEALLFVGRPDSNPITAAEIAGLMRGVGESEVVELVASLNKIYSETGRATRIVASAAGYRMQLADDLGFMREQFYGRARPVSLNQAAIDCLALVAYQPGISREKLEEQRGQPSGPVLNQLVRRQLLEIRRETEGKKMSVHYYPTQRLLQLAGMTSLDDLPLAEDYV